MLYNYSNSTSMQGGRDDGAEEVKAVQEGGLNGRGGREVEGIHKLRNIMLSKIYPPPCNS